MDADYVMQLIFLFGWSTGMLELWRFFGNTISSLLGGRRKRIINGFWVAGGGLA